MWSHIGLDSGTERENTDEIQIKPGVQLVIMC